LSWRHVTIVILKSDRHRRLLARRYFEKRLHLEASLYTILQILSLTFLENTPISEAHSQLPLPPSPAIRRITNVCLISKPDSSDV
jgi:hypothetical protein